MAGPSKAAPPSYVAQKVVVLTLLVAAAAILLCGRITPDGANVLGTLALIAGVIATELRPVHLARRGQRQSFTLTEGPLVAALALSPGRYVVVAVAAAMLVAQVVRRVPPQKLTFNVAQYALAAAAATLCAEQLGGVSGVIGGIAVFAIVNDAVMRLVMFIVTGERQGHLLQGTTAAWLVHVCAATSVALIAADLLEHSPELLPAFLAPVLLIQLSQEQANRRQARSAIAGALAHQATTLYGRASHESAALILRSARELLLTSEVEIILLGSSGATSLLDRGPLSEHAMSRVPAEELLTGWRGRVLELPAAAIDGHWGGVVIGRSVPHALLSVRRAPDAEQFRDSDRALLQALADNVASWLDVDADVDAEDVVQTARRRAAQIGGGYAQAAEALGAVDRISTILLGQQDGSGNARDTYLGEELRAAASGLAEFVSSLITPPSQPTGADADLVQTGEWTGTRT